MSRDDHRNDAIVRRLRRIEGQVRGIEEMVNDDRSCVDILQQIASARTALGQVGFKLLERHVERCIAEALASGDERTAAIQTSEMLTAVQRFVRMR